MPKTCPVHGRQPGDKIAPGVNCNGESTACGQARRDEEKDGECRTCGEPYADGGDGFDGECPACADKTEARR